ncbi:MAG: hypothetical protein AAGC55_20430 [Myxococcota bacterium]
MAAQSASPSGAAEPQSSASPSGPSGTDASADSADSEQDAFGDLERAAIATALARLGREREPAPEGKIVGDIVVINFDVFTEDDGFFQIFNLLHMTTTADVIAREVLLRPGQTWSAEAARETERNLRDPLFSSVVAISPIRAAKPGQVDLLVVTRDVWSLRTNSQFEVQDGVLTTLLLRPAEYNFLGRRKQLGAIFDMDLGRFAVGPRYTDRNVLGRRLELDVFAGLVFNRDDQTFEGSQSEVLFALPLWSLKRKWGWSVSFSHDNSFSRDFEGTDLALYDAPETEVDDMVPREFERGEYVLSTEVTRSLGTRFKHNFTAGHEFILQRPRLADSFMGDATVQAAFERDILPRSERSSALVARYNLFRPRYVPYRNVDTFDLTEATQVGPELVVETAAGLTLIGSEANFLRIGVVPAVTIDFGGRGLLRVEVNLSTRVERTEDGDGDGDGDGDSGDGLDLVDNELDMSAKLVSPPLMGWIRVVSRLRLALRRDDRQNVIYVLGGETGLRGFDIGQFRGRTLLVGNLALRSEPLDIWFTKAGITVFYDGGHAADTIDELSLQHNVGLGLRVLIPQTGVELFRFDWAVPLTSGNAGLPGRFTFGFVHVF